MPDPHRRFDRGNEHLAVADLAGPGCLHDRIDRSGHAIVRGHDLHFDLGKKIDRVLAAPVDLSMALLTSESLDLGDRHAFDPNFVERFLQVLQFEGFDYRFDLLHE